VSLAASVVAIWLIGADVTRAGRRLETQATQTAKPTRDTTVTPVAGPSWLNRLGVRANQTTLGRSGATYGPPPGERSTMTAMKPLTVGPVALTGADLYRLNCQSCHRAEGTGAGAEIKPVFEAVQGSSLELMRKQLSKEGKPAGLATSAQADRARAELRNRIQKGGQRMPALSHLQDADLATLYEYLLQLSGAAAVPKSKVTASWSRLGEHVIKGTCHICHDAVGPRPTSKALLEGTIPPFSVLIEEKPVVEFLQKVRSGAAVRSSDPVLHFRGRMPVFSYLREVEVAAAYTFLVDYPPQAR
jgi:mono/diheme cytochrome c family protein